MWNIGAACRHDAALPVSHPVIEIVNVRPNVRMSQHDALGTPVVPLVYIEGESRVWVVTGARAGAVCSFQRLFVQHHLPEDLASGMGNEECRTNPRGRASVE